MAVSQATSDVSNDAPTSKSNPIAVTMFSNDADLDKQTEVDSDSLHIEKGRRYELVPSSNRPRSCCCWVCVASVALPSFLIILLLLLSAVI